VVLNAQAVGVFAGSRVEEDGGRLGIVLLGSNRMSVVCSAVVVVVFHDSRSRAGAKIRGFPSDGAQSINIRKSTPPPGLAASEGPMVHLRCVITHLGKEYL
jgi:hypothetical protein